MELIRAEHLWKRYHLRRQQPSTLRELIPSLLRRQPRDEVWALQDVSFQLGPGEALGVIGVNGSGKSTLLKILAGILQPTRGELMVNGRIGGLIELGAGFHPEFTGRENIFLNGSILGLRRAEIKRKLDAIVAFAGLEPFIDIPVKHYSSGMYLRLGFAIAAHVEPDVLLVDEVLAVGDAAFQRKCVEHVRQFRERGGALVLVSHDEGLVERVCQRALWLDHGVPRAIGPAEQVIGQYVQALRNPADGNRTKSHGDSPVRIIDVQILDASGTPCHHFSCGDPVTVRFAYRAVERIRQPAFGLTLIREDGIWCYSTTTRIDGVAIDAIEGEGTVTLSFASLPLLSGRYWLDLAILDARDVPYDYFHGAARFDVRAHHAEAGIFRPPHRWEITGGVVGADVADPSVNRHR